MRQHTVIRASAAILATFAAVIAACDGATGPGGSEVAEIQITPPTASIPVDGTVQLTATIHDDAGNPLDTDVFWASEDDALASVSRSGVVTGVAPGSVRIAASSGGSSALATITIEPKPVARVVIAPSSATLRIGEKQQFTATALDADGNELSDRGVSWSSSEPEIVQISSSGLATAVAIGAASVSATIDGTTASVGVGVGLTPVATVTVSPSTVQLEIGERATLAAVLKAADDSILTERAVTWSSGNESVATVGAGGEVTAVAAGTVTITATAEGKKGTAEVTVVAKPVASVEVLPTSFTLVVGGTAQLEAVAKAADGSTLDGRAIAWTSADRSIATVSADGLVTAVAPGTAKITASSEGKSASTTVTVQTEPVASVEIDPGSATVFVGATRQLEATARDRSGAELKGRFVTWSSGDARVAVVDPSGLVAGVSPGRAIITATSEGKSATAEITVVLRRVAAVEVTPSSATVLVGNTRQLEVTVKAENGSVLSGRSVKWSSKQAGVASVNGSGLVTAISPGTATIEATSEGVTGAAVITVQLKPVATVEVTPSSAVLTVDGTQQLQAKLEASDGTVLTGRDVKWTSSKAAVASVSAGGLVTARAPGTAKITGTSEGRSDAATITVEAKTVATVAISPRSAALNVGDEQQFTATALASDGTELSGHAVTWTSTVPAIVEISSTGMATARAIGTATIRATIAGKVGEAPVGVGLPPVATITISPSSLALVVGEGATLTATLKAANGTVITDRDPGWASDDPAVATVNAAGEVRAVSPGTAKIAASIDGKEATATVTVTPKPVATVTISPPDAELIVGETRQLNAILRASDGSALTGREVAWSSSDRSVATVSSDGLVKAVKAGKTTITASSEGRSGTAEITVSRKPVATVEVTPTSLALEVGGSETLQAVPRAADGSALTGRSITWSSDEESVATVSTSGEVTAIAPGSATITATSEGQSGSVTVTVSAVPVATVEVTPSSLALVVGGSETLQAIPRDADGAALTGRSITWSSDNESVATVSTSGAVTAVAPGSTTITATSEGQRGSATVTVSAVPVATVEVTPSSLALVVGGSETLQAIPRDADGSALTGRIVDWTSDNGSVATVDGSGVVTAIAPGSATITATSEGQSGSAAIAVSAAVAPVATVVVSPPADTLFVGETGRFTAETRAADGTVLADRSIAWMSGDEAVATVTATGGDVTAVAKGVTTITATSEGQNGLATLTVLLPPAELVIVSGNNQSGRANETLPEPLVIRVLDEDGGPVGNVLVRWSTRYGSISPAETLTGNDGTTGATWTLGWEWFIAREATAEVSGLPQVTFVSPSASL